MNVLAVGDALAREGVLLVSLAAILLLGSLIGLVLRTRSLPVCRNCGFHSVRRSHSHHRPWDTLARIFFLYPHRCEKCLRRIYCFPSRRVPRHSGGRSKAAGKG
jgi:hypothetical protein